MAFRPAARLRWTPACRRACATSEGGERAECSPANSRAAPDGTGGKERESRGDEGSCLRGRLSGPRRRPDRPRGVGSRLFFPGRLIGPQTRIPHFVGGAGVSPLRWVLRDRR
ncbi:hypothetical protein COCOBI_02-6750 [Coccomyxa sp. Obi]|nr:hypothetical protein COCOBI_02-5020 [Coccomyxa sp. Obi]BDA41718.1 hypothetical protein COCOBI_02-5110 [Coccomyxa sp. Obi]BDA41880.1 hypothetical protein COCOBI_02-6750 [Coccomyxa sp. Obi]